MDKKSSNSLAGIKDKAKPLEKSHIRVIPVAVGTDANLDELEKITSNKQNLIEVPKDEKPDSLGQQIMDKILQRML